VGIDERRQRPKILHGQPCGPGGLTEHPLQHQGIDIDQGVLEQMQREHRQLLVFAPIRGNLSAFAKEDKIIRAVPILDDSEAKFAVVVETAALNEAELGEYCRKRGLYPEQVHAWRRVCEQANQGAGWPRRSEAVQADRQRILELERELRRKEQALAEAAALLVLGPAGGNVR
jgi:transposase-like protein